MGDAPPQTLRRLKLKAVGVTAANFAPYGQLIEPTDDGAPYDAAVDARLDLCRGGAAAPPRFYIMRLPLRGRRFTRITFHARVTQCLGGLAPPAPWFLAVAAPSGSVSRSPRVRDLAAFRVPPGVALKLDAGTWHAGPLFDGDASGGGDGSMTFYNLELADTNVADHNTHDYAAAEGIEFEVVD